MSVAACSRCAAGGSLLALPVPASAGPRTDAAFVRATNADRREAG